MIEPIDLSRERSARREQYDGLTCSCGSAWFFVQSVCINGEGGVTGYLAPVICRECGNVLVDGAWLAPDLALTDGGDLRQHGVDLDAMCETCGMPRSRCATVSERNGGKVDHCCNDCDHPEDQRAP